MVAHPYLNYHHRSDPKEASDSNFNSYGFRGPEVVVPKPPGIYRIVMIGGSTTFDTGIRDWHLDSARQLQKYLREIYAYEGIEVVNAGVSGYASWESLINLEFKALDVEPDMVIIYDNINDVLARLVEPAYYRADNSGFRKPMDPKMPFPSNLAAVRLATGELTHIYYYVRARTSLLHLFEGNYARERNDRIAGVLQANKPIFFQRNLRNEVAIAHEFGAKVIVATYAFTDQFKHWMNMPANKAATMEHNEIIRHVQPRPGVFIYDHAAEFPNDKSYFSDTLHLNENGARLRGEMFAKFISRNKIMDSKVTELKSAKRSL